MYKIFYGIYHRGLLQRRLEFAIEKLSKNQKTYE